MKEIYETADFDYILHVGVGLDGGYQLEMVARKEGYTRVDVDGLGPADGDGGKAVGTMGHWAGGGAAKRVTGPSKIIWDKDEMRVGLDVEWICRVVEKGGVKFEDEDEGVDEILDQGGWVELVKRIPPPPGTKTSPKKKKNGAHAADVPNDQPGFITRPSTNAGLFLCEYILRKSLEEAIRRKRSGARRPWDWRKRYGGRVGRGPGGGYVTMEGRETPANVSKRVLFMHVPNVGKPYTIEDGVKELKSVVIRMVLDGEGLCGEGWYD